MGFRLVPKSVTLNYLKRRNGSYFALFQRIFMYDVAVKNYEAYIGFRVYF